VTVTEIGVSPAVEHADELLAARSVRGPLSVCPEIAESGRGGVLTGEVLCPHCLDLLETVAAHERTAPLHEQALGRDLRIGHLNRIGGYQTVYRDLLWPGALRRQIRGCRRPGTRPAR